MTDCPNCGTRLDQGNRFCSFCGSFNTEYHTTPEDVQRLWQAAQQASKRQDYANSVTLLKQVIELAPGMLEVYYYLTDVYHNLGQFDLALAIMRQAQALRPGSSTIAFNLGILEKRTGHLFEARQHLQEALRLLETDDLINNRDELRGQMQKQLAEM